MRYFTHSLKLSCHLLIIFLVTHNAIKINANYMINSYTKVELTRDGRGMRMMSPPCSEMRMFKRMKNVERKIIKLNFNCGKTLLY